jgi:hypothetical protein
MLSIISESLDLATLFLHFEIHHFINLIFFFSWLSNGASSKIIPGVMLTLSLIVYPSGPTDRSHSEVLREELLIFEVFQEILSYSHTHILGLRLCLSADDLLKRGAHDISDLIE